MSGGNIGGGCEKTEVELLCLKVCLPSFCCFLEKSIYLFQDMTTKNWGGSRSNPGRKKGSGAKMKICVTVDSDRWREATSRWNDKKSRLVDHLLAQYLTNEAQ